MTQTTATGNTPKVTVILSTHNRAAYLTQAIDSIRAQTLKDWELIIVDDASTDKTPEVAQTFTLQDSRIRYHRHRTNQGAAVARNTGIKRARGTYIASQDDDDLSHPERLQRQVEDLQTRPHYAFVRTWKTEFYTDTPYEWSKGEQNIITTSENMVTIMAPRHLLQHTSYRPFFPILEDRDLGRRLEELCSLYNKGAKSSTFMPTLPYPLYAVRNASQTSRLSMCSFDKIYLCLVGISANHRRHGLPDPIDNARTIDDAIGNIHPRFADTVRRDPPLTRTITELLDTCIVQSLTDKHDTLTNHAEQLAQKCFRQSLGDYISSHTLSSDIIKSHLHLSIRHHDRATYLSLLRGINRLIPNSLRLIAPKVVFACLRRGCFSFILPLIKTLLRMKK